MDLELTPLEIKTDSALGSGQMVRVWFFSSASEFAGGLEIYFDLTPAYSLNWCGERVDFSSNLPTDMSKTWRVTLSKTSDIRMQIHCNEVEMVNFVISSNSCSNETWSTFWNRDIAMIRFNSEDTASKYYRINQQGKWNCSSSVLINAQCSI